jgi:hypothetical protein
MRYLRDNRFERECYSRPIPWLSWNRGTCEDVLLRKELTYRIDHSLWKDGNLLHADLESQKRLCWKGRRDILLVREKEALSLNSFSMVWIGLAMKSYSIWPFNGRRTSIIDWAQYHFMKL